MEDIIESRTIVVMVMGVIFLGFVLYLFLTDRKITRLEKELKKKAKGEA